MKKKIIMFFVHLRWAYFHLNPRYVKFSITGEETYFQNVKTGEIVCNLTWVDS